MALQADTSPAWQNPLFHVRRPIVIVEPEVFYELRERRSRTIRTVEHAVKLSAFTVSCDLPAPG
jgi:hypothetical protein